MIDLEDLFKKHNDEHGKFELVESKLHPCPDICAFLVLDKLTPNNGRDMINVAEHDQIWLSVDCGVLAEIATEEDVILLTRCGVFYDRDVESLSMFV